ncbi:hypothetical protein AZ78_2352 [Lysobacter capsici AZ78]|uniref:Uncharacterized protein n=1 Tax=Lysobacter capsici AZ78 TaxID=1444315 RepID=A0A108U923_9GAMM|nr:hypothetical protein AZ78_2352 [Lysobacter capsici AZ78]
MVKPSRYRAAPAARPIDSDRAEPSRPRRSRRSRPGFGRASKNPAKSDD